MELSKINWQKMSYQKLLGKQSQIAKRNRALKKKQLKNTVAETMVIILFVLLLYFLLPYLTNFFSDVEFLTTLKKVFSEQFAVILVAPTTIFFFSRINKIPPTVTKNNKALTQIKENLEKKR